MGTTLVINPGSSSRKYELYRGSEKLLDVRFEKTDNGFEACMASSQSKQTCSAVTEFAFKDSIGELVGLINSNGRSENGFSVDDIDTVVVRIVAPGSYFQQHHVITKEFVQKLKAATDEAPLHIPAMLGAITKVQTHFPAATWVAASDSAFHATLPPRARSYSIPAADAKTCEIYRFGYHGLSVASIARRIHSVIGQEPERMIVCHIGSGTSVTAVKRGQSVDTSMGYGPASGVPMSSRAGAIDNPALFALMRHKSLHPADAELYLNTQGGLLGLGGDSDLRRLLDRRSHNDAIAIHALDTFAYHLQKEIASQTIALGGLDVLVFTATAAVRSSTLRQLILDRLGHLGISYSEDRNDALVGKDGVISTRNSLVKVVVMRTDEMGEMVAVARSVVEERQ
jgi:acetate kinase